MKDNKPKDMLKKMSQKRREEHMRMLEEINAAVVEDFMSDNPGETASQLEESRMIDVVVAIQDSMTIIDGVEILKEFLNNK